MFIVRIILSLIIVSFCSKDLVAADNHCFDSSWPHELSSLQPDSRLTFGRLDNGFRYVILDNKKPKDRVGLYLNVQVGSVYETEEQRGVAHFLEHMVFNGTKNFPPGKLIEYFQSIGMSFGGDTNAHTSFNETVYKILLPENSNKAVEKGLLVLSDYAQGALLLESEVDKERGVVLAEKRSRDSIAYRTYEAVNRFSMKGTIIPSRLPIGTTERLQTVNRQIIKNFYDDWYRPEKMILVVIGDIQRAEIEAMIKKTFSVMKSPLYKKSCPTLGLLDMKGTNAFYYYEPDAGNVDLSIETLWNEKTPDDSFIHQKKTLQSTAVNMIINHRLQRLSEGIDPPFTSGKINSGSFLGQYKYGDISVTTDKKNWRQSLGVIENILRDVQTNGVRSDELDRVKKELISSFDTAVLTSSARKSQDIARNLIRHLNNNKVYMSAQQQKELYSPVVSRLTIKEVNQAFKEIWHNHGRNIIITGNVQLPDNEANEIIMREYANANNNKIMESPLIAKPVFPYLVPKDEDILPTKEEYINELDAEKIFFDNGVVLNLKKTDFKKNTFLFSVDFGEGKMSEPTSGMGLLAELIVNKSGTAKINREQLSELLAGTALSVDFKTKKTSFSWAGRAVTKDSELLITVLRHLLQDPGFSENMFRVVKRDIDAMYTKLKKEVSGSMQLYGPRFFANGNPFYGMPLEQGIKSIEFSSLKEWILPIITSSKLEISIVGDFDRDLIVALVGKNLADIKRDDLKQRKKMKIDFPLKQIKEINIGSQLDKAMVTVAWKTTDFSDISKVRRLHVLASLFDDKLRKSLREKLGVVYSPVVYNMSSRVFKDYGLLQINVLIDPKNIELVTEEVEKIGEELWHNGVDHKELHLITKPIYTSLKDMTKTNYYWLNSVLSQSEKFPQQLQWPMSIISDFKAINHEEISSMAKQYLAPEKSSILVITP